MVCGVCVCVCVCVCVPLCSHLTKLEGEATTMKDVLCHLQTTMELDEDGDSNLVDITSSYPDYQTPPPRLAPTQQPPRDDNDRDLDQNSNSSNGEQLTCM